MKHLNLETECIRSFPSFDFMILLSELFGMEIHCRLMNLQTLQENQSSSSKVIQIVIFRKVTLLDNDYQDQKFHSLDLNHLSIDHRLVLILKEECSMLNLRPFHLLLPLLHIHRNLIKAFNKHFIHLHLRFKKHYCFNGNWDFALHPHPRLLKLVVSFN